MKVKKKFKPSLLELASVSGVLGKGICMGVSVIRGNGIRMRCAGQGHQYAVC